MNFIQFPYLFGGISFLNNPVAFRLFGIDIYWYGIIISAGFAIATLLALRNSKKGDIPPEEILDLLIYVIPLGIIGARLYYVIFNWKQFNTNLLEICNIRTGGLAIYGGIIGGTIGLYLFAKKRKKPFLKLLDFLVPYLALAQAIGRWGNFVNQESFGVNTALPWAMTGNKIVSGLFNISLELKSHGIIVNPLLPVHPTFLYESIWCIIIMIITLWYSKRKKFVGEVLLLYLMLYGLGRFWIESIRIDSLWIGSFRVSQIISILLVIGSITTLNIIKQKAKNSPQFKKIKL